MKGIYIIRNKINNKVYIGSSNNLRKRFIKHKSRLNRCEHKNPHLQSSWNKYGKENFVFEILLLCEEFELLRYEQHYLDNVVRWGLDYNVAGKAGAPFLGRRHTQLTKEKISSSLLGRTIPEEQRLKISKSLSGKKRPDMVGKNNPMYGKVLSDDTREKISLKVRGSNNPKAKLSEDDVLEIRRLNVADKHTRKELENMFEISRSALAHVILRKTWKHI